MNIAIILGVSEYKENIQDLPGSKNDTIAFHSLIQKTEKYDDILVLNDKQSSGKIKTEISHFFEKYKGENINEFLFYFTGHGDFANDEFYYILPDFEFNKRQQTSLQNSELDNLIKSINPKLVSKIVDACHSGVNYIKNINIIDTYIKSTANKFNNCYFLFSSLNNQSSFQNKDYSFFTLSLLNAIKNSGKNEVRYKDIIDYISDEFSKFPEQTPFFITQADFTENFCKKNSKLNTFLKTIPQTFPSESKNELKQSEFNSIEDLVKADSEKNVSYEQTNELLVYIKEIIDNFKLDSKLANIYSYDIKYLKYIPRNANYHKIGQFVRQNPNYFAEVETETESYEDVIKPSRFDLFTANAKPYTITKTREVVSGYRLNIDYEFNQIVIDINGKYPNLISFNCNVAFITTDREIRLYYFITDYRKSDWDNREINKRYQWNVKEFLIINKKEIKDFTQSINDDINKRILSYIEEKFKLKE